MWQVSKDGRLERLVVYADCDGQPVPVGGLAVAAGGGKRTALFQYGSTWLDDRRKFALAPSGLPLRKTAIQGAPYEAPLPFYDAAPDGWGKMILAAAFPHQVFGMLEYLAATGAERTGELSFGPTHTSGPQRWIPPHHQEFTLPDGTESLADLLDAAEAVDSGEAKRHHLHLLFRSSADQGGARPKAAIIRDGRHYLTKFPALGDTFDDPKVEAVCLSLARLAGIETPLHEVIRVGTKSVLLVERFDRAADGRRLGFSSTATLMGSNPTDYYSQVTYADIAAKARSWGVTPCERELFKRVLFNAFIHNTDDHLKNHGFLREDGQWRLSPIFDLSVHRPNRLVLAPARGVSPEADPKAIFEAYPSFALSRTEAEAIYSEIVSGLSYLPTMLQKYEVTTADREVLAPFLKHALAPPGIAVQVGTLEPEATPRSPNGPKLT